MAAAASGERADCIVFAHCLSAFPPACSGEQAEAIEREGIRPDVFLLINVSAPEGSGGGGQSGSME